MPSSSHLYNSVNYFEKGPSRTPGPSSKATSSLFYFFFPDKHVQKASHRNMGKTEKYKKVGGWKVRPSGSSKMSAKKQFC